MEATFNTEEYGNLLTQYQPKVIDSKEEYYASYQNLLRLMYEQDQRSPEETELLKLIIALIKDFELNTES